MPTDSIAIGDQQLTDVPGRPRVITLPGHTPGSVGYLFPDRGLLFTGMPW